MREATKAEASLWALPAGDYIEAVEQEIQAKGIELLYEELDSGADGVSCKGKIIIDPKMKGAERFAVLTHELAHEILHADKSKRLQTTKTIRETEAKAVAHVVCRAVGLDSTTHSADYTRSTAVTWMCWPVR